MDHQKIGVFIAAMWKEQGLTQKELSDRLHVSDRAVSKWERGLNLPDANLFEPLCGELGITITELLRGEREAPTIPQLEQVVSDAVALAERKEYIAERNKAAALGLLFLLGWMGLFAFILWGGPAGLISYIQYLQYSENAPVRPPAVELRLQDRYADDNLILTYVELVPGGCYFPDENKDARFEDGDLLVTRSPDSEDVQNLYTVDVSEIESLRFRLRGGYPKNENFEVEVVRYPVRDMGTPLTLDDSYYVNWSDKADSATAPDADWFNDSMSIQLYPDYYYAVIVSWGDGYFAEYPFLTT